MTLTLEALTHAFRCVFEPIDEGKWSWPICLPLTVQDNRDKNDGA